MKVVRKFRIQAIFCVLAVLVCELISRPFASIGICDDWPYILMTQHLATTGHIVYNGWAAAMIGWQLYLGAAFIKLFGMSLTTVRMSTLVVALATTFLLQRTLVRCNISERNATVGTLALVLSPLFLMLSVTFMTDIQGLFAIVACLYGCVRALQSSTSRAAIGWLCAALALNAICGSARQIAWLGVLVMVPSTLWLLRGRRTALLTGAVANVAGVAFIFGCMLWFKQQPYTQPEHLFTGFISVSHGFKELIGNFAEIPYLLLPVAALFLPQLRRRRPWAIAALFLVYLFVAVHPYRKGPLSLLEPTQGDWVGVPAIFQYLELKGTPPDFFHTGIRILITIISLGGVLGFFISLYRVRSGPAEVEVQGQISWSQLKVLLAPYAIAYVLLLVPRATTFHLTDRYTLGLLVPVLIYLVRYYQDRVQARIPWAAVVLVGVVGVYGVVITHNLFALYRARAAMAAEIRAAGVPDTSVDNGWEYNIDVELQHAAYINDYHVEFPVGAYRPTPPPPAGTCAWGYDRFPHIHAIYGVSFDPNECYGPAPFAPVHYSRWLARRPGTLYVVKYRPPSADVARSYGAKLPLAARR